jgi:hypothetical protein
VANGEVALPSRRRIVAGGPGAGARGRHRTPRSAERGGGGGHEEQHEGGREGEVVAVSAAEHEEERVGRAATGVELVGRGIGARLGLFVVRLRVDHRGGAAAARQRGRIRGGAAPVDLRSAAGGNCLTDAVKDAAIPLECSLLCAYLPLPQHWILQMGIGSIAGDSLRS